MTERIHQSIIDDATRAAIAEAIRERYEAFDLSMLPRLDDRVWPELAAAALSVGRAEQLRQGQKFHRALGPAEALTSCPDDVVPASLLAVRDRELEEAREALPDPAKLRLLADLFDSIDSKRGVTDRDGVQQDLRRWADQAEAVFRARAALGKEQG